MSSYLEPLAIALDDEKWSLVQLLMSSSYTGFGTSSLKQVTYVSLLCAICIQTSVVICMPTSVVAPVLHFS